MDQVLAKESASTTSSINTPPRERSLMAKELETPAISSMTPAGSLGAADAPHTAIETKGSTSTPSPRMKAVDASTQQTMFEVDRLLAWPAIQALLQCDSINLSQYDGNLRDTEKWLLDISYDFDAFLPLDPPVDIHYADSAMLSLQSGQAMTLNRGYVETICSIYFKTFHCTYPILDRSQFFSKLLPQVCSESFGEANPGSALVLLVIALGALAQEGATGVPLIDETGRRTGIKGGSVDRPPGLVFLNEAKRRLVVSLTEWSLDSLLCYMLCA